MVLEVDMLSDKEINENELESRARIIYDTVKEVVENPTEANKRLFKWACHEIWMLKAFDRVLTSKKAYQMFYEIYKKDIRDFDWFDGKISKIKDNNGKRMFMQEHLTTTDDFKNELIHLYKNNELSVQKVKQLILQQRICWITREEDNKLNAKGYRKHRDNPLEAYKDCEIEIYESDKASLNNLMIPSFELPKKSGGRKRETVKAKQPSEISNETIELLETIKSKMMSELPDFNVHYSMSYFQIWKKTWNNQGKRGIHFELKPQKTFGKILGIEKFRITINLHNEDNTRDVMPQIPRSQMLLKKEYSFLKQDTDNSINALIQDVKRQISLHEKEIDNAHNV